MFSVENCTTGISQNGSCIPAKEGTLLSEPGFVGLYVILILVLFLAMVITWLLLLSLCCNPSVPGVLATFLVNQLAACTVVNFITSAIALTGLTLTLDRAFSLDIGGLLGQASTNQTLQLDTPSLSFCQFLIWGYGFGAVGRLWCLVAFSIVILITVKYGQRAFKCAHILVCVIAVWTVTFILNIHVMLPYPMYAVQFVDNVACFPHNAIIPKASRYPTLAIWIVFGGITPLTISITIPIITLCYIRRNTITEGAQYNKRIAKFALFLVVGNVVNLLGQAVPGLVALYAEAPGVILAYVFVTVSLLPTPVIILVFMKPVRERMKRILHCSCSFKTTSTRHEGSFPSTSNTLNSTIDLATRSRD